MPSCPPSGGLQVGHTNEHFKPIILNDVFRTDSCFATALLGDSQGRYLNHNHNRVYSLLRNSGPLTQVELKLQLGISQSLVSTLIRDLTKWGLTTYSTHREQSVAGRNNIQRGKPIRYYSVTDKPLPADDSLTRLQRQQHQQERREHLQQLRDDGLVMLDGDQVRYVTGEAIPVSRYEFLFEKAEDEFVYRPAAKPLVIVSDKKKAEQSIPETNDDQVVFQRDLFPQYGIGRNRFRRIHLPYDKEQKARLYQLWFQLEAEFIPNSVHTYNDKSGRLVVERWFYEQVLVPQLEWYEANEAQIREMRAERRAIRYAREEEKARTWQQEFEADHRASGGRIARIGNDTYYLGPDDADLTDADF
jgi:hypothetical protein